MNTEKKRILVVDDRPRDSHLVKICLEHDYDVMEENDATAAVATAERFQPELILLDIMMPGKDGGLLAAAIHERPSLKDVPIVFLTALVTADEVQAGGGMLGNHPFLAKPIVPAELVACVQEKLAAVGPAGNS